MLPRIVSFGMTQGGLSSSCLRQMEGLLESRDAVHLMISDESSAPQLAQQFVKKFGYERLDEKKAILNFVCALECGHVFGAIKQLTETHADKEINVYLDVPSMTGIRTAIKGSVQVTLTDKMQSIELDNLLEQNPIVVVRVASLRMSAKQMVDFARATGTLTK